MVGLRRSYEGENSGHISVCTCKRGLRRCRVGEEVSRNCHCHYYFKEEDSRKAISSKPKKGVVKEKETYLLPWNHAFEIARSWFKLDFKQEKAKRRVPVPINPAGTANMFISATSRIRKRTIPIRHPEFHFSRADHRPHLDRPPPPSLHPSPPLPFFTAISMDFTSAALGHGGRRDGEIGAFLGASKEELPLVAPDGSPGSEHKSDFTGASSLALWQTRKEKELSSNSFGKLLI
ncbi:hypothetical protein BHE74_00036414 [Ensete ventricosum]|nr:hypothetical protein BHE74_00036414 [Ensete ventricosum]